MTGSATRPRTLLLQGTPRPTRPPCQEFWIQITYDTADTARSISQAVTVRTGTTPEGDQVIARILEATQLTLDSMGRRQTETTTSTSLDSSGNPAGAGQTISSLTRHYGDTIDNPAWSFTDTPARDGRPAQQERAVTGEGIGGYTATITSSITGTLTGVSLNVANLHGDITTTIPLDAVTTITAAGLGPAASSITGWQHTDEYGNPRTAPTSAGTHVPRTVGERPGAATTSGPAYGWLGTSERGLTSAGLSLMGERLYNPASATFTSVDPIAGGNTNSFTYPQDPMNQTDLDGRSRIDKLSGEEHRVYYMKKKSDLTSAEKKTWNKAHAKIKKNEKIQKERNAQKKRGQPNRGGSGSRGGRGRSGVPIMPHPCGKDGILRNSSFCRSGSRDQHA